MYPSYTRLQDFEAIYLLLFLNVLLPSFFESLLMYKKYLQTLCEKLMYVLTQYNTIHFCRNILLWQEISIITLNNLDFLLRSTVSLSYKFRYQCGIRNYYYLGKYEWQNGCYYYIDLLIGQCSKLPSKHELYLGRQVNIYCNNALCVSSLTYIQKYVYIIANVNYSV